MLGNNFRLAAMAISCSLFGFACASLPPKPAAQPSGRDVRHLRGTPIGVISAGECIAEGGAFVLIADEEGQVQKAFCVPASQLEDSNEEKGRTEPTVPPSRSTTPTGQKSL